MSAAGLSVAATCGIGLGGFLDALLVFDASVEEVIVRSLAVARTLVAVGVGAGAALGLAGR